MLLAKLQSKHGADEFYYIYHIRNIIRVTENVIYHIRRYQKLDCLTSTKWPPDFARLNNNFISIYHNYFGMSLNWIHTNYFSPKYPLKYFDAAFLLQTLKSTAAYSVIDVNNEPEVKLTIQKLASLHHTHWI